jgi:hypothetical protein
VGTLAVLGFASYYLLALPFSAWLANMRLGKNNSVKKYKDNIIENTQNLK